jgi:hypothetical protein
MREPDDRPGPLALSFMAAAHVEDLRDAADTTAALVRELLELPDIPDHNLTKREAMLALMVWQKVELAKQLLARVERGDLA